MSFKEMFGNIAKKQKENDSLMVFIASGIVFFVSQFLGIAYNFGVFTFYNIDFSILIYAKVNLISLCANLFVFIVIFGYVWTVNNGMKFVKQANKNKFITLFRRSLLIILVFAFASIPTYIILGWLFQNLVSVICMMILSLVGLFVVKFLQFLYYREVALDNEERQNGEVVASDYLKLWPFAVLVVILLSFYIVSWLGQGSTASKRDYYVYDNNYVVVAFLQDGLLAERFEILDNKIIIHSYDQKIINMDNVDLFKTDFSKYESFEVLKQQKDEKQPEVKPEAPKLPVMIEVGEN